LLAPVIHRCPLVMLSTKVSCAGGAPRGAADTKKAGAGISRDVAFGDVALAPRSLGAMSPGLPREYLPGSPSSVSLPINKRRVENKVESMCSQVATAERLLHEALASVHHNILCPIRFSLAKEARFLSVF
jgi:hypothetical protein